jgi:glycosyltransferase involved in cell wall biosynthesis
VVDQDYAGEIECIVVHDGEEPDESLESEDTRRRVRVIANLTHHRGLPGARNAGLDVARGDFVASLDDDDLWMGSKVRKQVDALLGNPDILVAASGIVLRTSGGRQWSRTPPPRVKQGDLVERRIMELHSSNLMMRRAIFELAGRYDEDIPLPEDYEWLLRATRHTDVLSVQEPLAIVDRSRPLGSGGRWPYRAIGREKLLAKHPELASTAAAAANVYGGIAFAHAAGGARREALRWLARCLERGRFGRWAVAASFVVAGIPAEWVEAAGSRIGKSA